MSWDLEIDTDDLEAARADVTDAAHALATGSDPAALAAPPSAAGSAPLPLEALRAVETWIARMVECRDRLTREATEVAEALARAVRLFEGTG